MNHAITVQTLRKSYGDTVAVEDVSFEVVQNEIFGIIGPNGSGKTTTVECLQGLRDATSGTVRVLGLDPGRQGDVLRQRIGTQLQESALPDRIKVWEALDLFAAATPVHREWRELAEEWGIFHRRDAAFANLSGGERQRLLVALALIRNPEVVFLDEMTTGLDPVARRVAWSLIEAVRERGATIVLVTHFMDEAQRLCDRVAVFKDGRIVAMDAPAELMLQHGQERTVTFSAESDDLAWLSQLPDVSTVERRGSQVVVGGTGAVLAHVAAELVARGIAPRDLRVDIPSLEDVYMNLVEEAPAE